MFFRDNSSLINLLNIEVMQRLLSLVIVLCVGFTLTSAGFREDGLLLHNNYRAKHDAAPLVLNEAVRFVSNLILISAIEIYRIILSLQLNNYAQNWAEQMARTDNFTHSKGKYGENIYYKGSTKLKLSDSDAVKRAINSWYDEISLYDFVHPGHLKGTGHFTAIVWKNSKNLGIGVARTANRVYVCANYDPPGNVKTRYAENVVEANV